VNKLTVGVLVLGLVLWILLAETALTDVSDSPVAPAMSAGNSDADTTAILAGELRGITRNPSGLPLVAAKVIVHATDGTPDRSVTSGADGAFAVDSLKPGRYQVTAVKEGFAPAPSTAVELTAAQNLNVDLVLVVAPTNGGNGGKFFGRLAKAYWSDWHPSTNPGAETPFRGYPAPVSSPPFPFSVWLIGGTVWIGYPNATSYPLTQALYDSKHTDWLKKANIQLYG
jgi:hypothetical protein